MTIEKMRLFKEAQGRWPTTVRVTPKEGAPSFAAEPDLFDLYRGIEVACHPTGAWTDEHEWTGLANWSFHQALWAMAEQVMDETHISRDAVTFRMFDERMQTNLADDGWAAERQEYAESPARSH